jgi:hypothetical protein
VTGVVAGIAEPSEAPESEDSVVVAVDIDVGDIIMGELLDIGDSIIYVRCLVCMVFWMMFETGRS